MTRLKTGDTCTCCGQPIKTDDPFALGYLSAIADLMRELEPSISCDGPSNDGPIGYDEYSRRFAGDSGRSMEVSDGKTD